MSDEISVRREKLERVRGRGENPYRNGLKPTWIAAEIHEKYGKIEKEALEAQSPPSGSVAGRILAIRNFGKTCFISLRDRSAMIQLYVTKAGLGDAAFEKFSELDLGDVIFAQGKPFKTKTGELSLACSQVSLLTKSLLPLPEKFHGLTDVETRYRQRYLDLMVSPESRAAFLTRIKMVALIRKFFQERDYLEVETPMLHSLVGGANARPFETHHNTLDLKLYMRIAPELHLKRLLVGGFDRVFEINRCFRNEGISVKHNPEFTSIEFYEAYATFEDFMSLSEELFQMLGRELCGSLEIPYQGMTIHLKGPWERLRVEEAVLKYSNFKDRASLRNREQLLDYGKKNNIAMIPGEPTGALLMKIFDEEVEKHLIQPVFITHYPLDVSPLSRVNEADPYLVDRFELYIGGREYANAFSELNDPADQRARFEAQVEAKKRGDKEACDMDEDYVTALEHGMPPAAGQGIGIDRLAMLFTNSASIRDVILFPLLRPHA